MNINGIIRIDMNGEEIEAALRKISGYPPYDDVRRAVDERPTFSDMHDALATKQDTLGFATENDINQVFNQ